MPDERMNKLLAAMALTGISRQRAALALHLSPGALNKKLRGQAKLLPGEWEALEKLILRMKEIKQS